MKITFIRGYKKLRIYDCEVKKVLIAKTTNKCKFNFKANNIKKVKKLKKFLFQV